MRLMLGKKSFLPDQKDDPQLLVSITDKGDYDKFYFYVINGCWEGLFDHGVVFVTERVGDGNVEAVAENVVVLCKDQNRLRGDYNDVFDNFDNPNYIAPKDKEVSFEDLDDDIPF